MNRSQLCGCLLLGAGGIPEPILVILVLVLLLSCCPAALVMDAFRGGVGGLTTVPVAVSALQCGRMSCVPAGGSGSAALQQGQLSPGRPAVDTSRKGRFRLEVALAHQPLVPCHVRIALQCARLQDRFYLSRSYT